MRRRGVRRLPIRARLAVSYASMVTGSVAVFIVIVYFFMRYVPMFRIAETLGGPRPDVLTSPARPTSVDIRGADDFLETFLVVSGVALVVLAVLGGIVGWVVAGRIVRPLSAINVAATRAATGNLDHRVGLEGPRDEVRDLADTFDRMLGSLERSFATHRRFAANASHELRTPLATTQAMIDVALADPNTDAAEFRALAGRVREMNTSSIGTVNALLDLCDVESGVRVRRPVDLAELSRAVVREHAAEATSAGVELRTPKGAAVALGDPVLIRQALSNLVRNAVRHNHRGGHAEVRPWVVAGTARLTVANTGPLVSRESVDSLVEPFVRGVGRGRRRPGSGHGLGLAIVSAVAAAHDGELRLSPRRDGGLTVRLDLPRADPNA